jgi:hypothetical protein
MASYTRRDFIRRGMEGAAGLGLLAPGKDAAGAASGRPVLPRPVRGPQTVAAHPTEIVVTATPVRERFGGVGFQAEMFLDVSTQVRIPGQGDRDSQVIPISIPKLI